MPHIMLTTEYIKAFKRYTREELKLTLQYAGKVAYSKALPYYKAMYSFVKTNRKNYILLKNANINYFEYMVANEVSIIRDKLLQRVFAENIPIEGIFVPRYKISDKLWDNIINTRIAALIREIFDTDKRKDFQTLRLFKSFERDDTINIWLNTKNGRNFLFELQVDKGIKRDYLIRKRLYHFDKDFVHAQMQYMSTKIWIHVKVIEAYHKWCNDNSLWESINHLKRKIEAKEIFDESRLEIKFRRLLEDNGLKGRFIHDEQISWKVKFRPDFWFVNENLIVEYDEKTPKSLKEEDKKRERLIKKYIPNVTFIRVMEGEELKSLESIIDFLNRHNEKYEA